MRILFLSWSSGLHKEAGGARWNPGRQGRGRTDGRTSVLLNTERLGRVGGPLPGLALPLPMNALIRTVLATRAKQHDRQVTSVPSQGRTCSTTTPMLTSLLRKDTDLLQRRSETRRTGDLVEPQDRPRLPWAAAALPPGYHAPTSTRTSVTQGCPRKQGRMLSQRRWTPAFHGSRENEDCACLTADSLFMRGFAHYDRVVTGSPDLEQQIILQDKSV